jgi:hypothetical protein
VRITVALLALACGCAATFDQELRPEQPLRVPPLAAGAPVLVYDLLVVVPGWPARVQPRESLADTVTPILQDLFHSRGVGAVPHAERPAADALLLTLIRGRHRTELWVDGAGVRLRYSATGRPRAALGSMLDRFVADRFPAR